MPDEMDDTICALATPPGTGGLGVIRVSGSRAFAIADAVSHCPRDSSYASLKGHTLHRTQIIGGDGAHIDDVLVSVFHAPRSYTGENVIEISAHGGVVPLRRILARLLECGARLARPGEFTQRAFLSGKIDLVQAEAVADIIAARTDEAHSLAQRQGEGALSRRIAAVRATLMDILARIEASIDFPEETGELDLAACARDMDTADADIAALLATADNGILLREGATLVLAGRPNVGKSSLLNLLLRASRAIVTPIPGTTRDTLEETLNLRGIPLRAIDTAGLRDTDDLVEKLGVERARDAMTRADFVLLVLDASTGEMPDDTLLRGTLIGRPHIVVWNKWDLVETDKTCTGGIPLSAATGWNVTALENAIADALFAHAAAPAAADTAIVSHARHRRALEVARESIADARRTMDAVLPADFLAIDMRGALSALGEITGETATVDIIQEIFSRFCIGK